MAKHPNWTYKFTKPDAKDIVDELCKFLKAQSTQDIISRLNTNGTWDLFGSNEDVNVRISVERRSYKTDD